jgi:hypothetical protein
LQIKKENKINNSRGDYSLLKISRLPVLAASRNFCTFDRTAVQTKIVKKKKFLDFSQRRDLARPERAVEASAVMVRNISQKSLENFTIFGL